MNTPTELKDLFQLLGDTNPGNTAADTANLISLLEGGDPVEEKLLIYKQHHAGRSIYSSYEQLRVERDRTKR